MVRMEKRTGVETMCPACNTQYLPQERVEGLDFSTCKYCARMGVDLCFQKLGQKKEGKMERTSNLIEDGPYHRYVEMEAIPDAKEDGGTRPVFAKEEDAKARCDGAQYDPHRRRELRPEGAGEEGTQFVANSVRNKGFHVAGVAGATCPHGVFLGPLITVEKSERYHYAAQALRNVVLALQGSAISPGEI